MNIKDVGGNIHTSVYDKRDDFGFPIVKFPLLSDVSRLPSYGIYISQLVRFACTSVLISILKLFKSLQNFWHRVTDITSFGKRLGSSLGHTLNFCPREGPGGLSRECAPPYPKRDRKRRLNGAVCVNCDVKQQVHLTFELLSKFGEISFQDYVSQGITLHVFYGDLVYKLRSPHEGLGGGLSRECVLRIPSVIVKGD